ncbi:jouberin-like isoform X2 [Ptychodera flava]|uniref:jouberin-like isoform X2 n=1 Tax=Ptychodera flava TaxID=63121 RepID=UPI003969E378
MEVEVDRKPLPRKKKKKVKATDKENDSEGGLSPQSDPKTAKIEELLKAAVDKSQSDGKKKKSKNKATEELLLQTIKSGKSIKKDTEDTSMAANIYNEDESPRTRKNTKNKKKSHAKESGIPNEGYIEETALDSQLDTPKKSAKKKVKKKAVLSDDGEMTISELEDTPRKKTKKKKPKASSPTPDDEKTEDEIEKIKSADEATKTEDDGERTSTAGTPRKTKKKKKKKAATEEDTPPDEEPAPPVDDSRVLGLYIHRSDRLKTDLNLTHPVVRVHIVDQDTGQYVKKKDSSRAVASYYEKENDNVDFILPIMTQPFDFKKRKTVIPAWEELLLFNESYLYLLQTHESYPKVIVFFELLDFVSMNAASMNYNNAKSEGGWHRIAWAFLKLVGSNNAPNTEKKIRLQLFYPPVNYRKKPGSNEVFQWWLYSTRQPYPSTLYVTVKGIRPPDNLHPSVRSMFATQKEEGTTSYKDLRKSIEWGGKTATGRATTKMKSQAMWSRLQGQVCHVPNKPTFQLNAGRKGCFVIKFSRDGCSLACGGADKSGYPISIFDIPSGRLRGQFPGHYSIIYDLCWSPKDNEILSASSDGTARIWDVESMSQMPTRIFPHPAFVYTARYHPNNENIIVTGGYDHVVRVWTKQSDQVHGELIHELEGHRGYVNCLCFGAEGEKMYTADSVGTIIIWNSEVGSKPKAKGLKGSWKIEKIVAEKEMEGVIINSIKLHPSGRRLLIHGRDNHIRMLDLRIYTIMQRYLGALNFREQLRSTFSACGTFVISGSEDYQAYVWNTDTGDQVAIYSDFGYKHPISDVEYHPYDHMIAFCSFGENHLVQIYTYDAKVAQLDLGIRQLVREADTEDEKDVTMRSTGKSDLQAVLATTELASETLSLQHARRMDSVSKKLASVSAFSSLLDTVRSRQTEMTGIGRSPGALGESYIQRSSVMTPADVTMNSTWGSTFDRSWQTPSTGPRPAMMSPHASMGMGTAQLAQQYQAATGSGWKKGPNISLSTGPGGKAQFTFSGPPQPLKDLKYRRVVALYDYVAQRSDELTIKRHDVITVLHQDSETWWMGELPNGQQGYFPSNYVTPEGEIEDDRVDGDDIQDEIEQVIKKPHVSIVSPSESDDLLDGTPRAKKKTKAKTKSQMSAVITKSGDFKVLSGPDETGSEVDIPTAPVRRKKKKQQALSDKGEATTDGDTPRRPKAKPKRRGSRESLLDDDDAPPVSTDTEKKGGKRKTKTKHVERTV